LSHVSWFREMKSGRDKKTTVRLTKGKVLTKRSLTPQFSSFGIRLVSTPRVDGHYVRVSCPFIEFHLRPSEQTPPVSSRRVERSRPLIPHTRRRPPLSHISMNI
jgi:hypothetical protein